MSALVSVIVPVYNVEKYLSQCLDSLVAQTYESIEVIMVNDGSKDSSGEICERYEKQHENFHLIDKENAGLGMARNTGLQHIRGEYVTFLDSDDYLEPDYIEELCTTLLKERVDMCKGGFKRVVDSGEVVSERKYQKELFQGQKARRELLPRMIGSSPSQHDSVEMCVCGAIYKTSLIEKYNLTFPSERELISEDLVFNIDYMQCANGACTIESVGYNYRINLKSLSTSYRTDRFEASTYFYLEIKKKLQKLGYEDGTMLRLDRMYFVYLKMCISQEKPKVSQKHIKDSIKMISRICKDSVVRNTIENYPCEQLEIKQKVFLWLIKNEKAIALYVAASAELL